MEQEQILVMVSTEAKDVLRAHKKACRFTQQGQALDDLLKTFDAEREDRKIALMEKGARIMISALVADRLLGEEIIAVRGNAATEAIKSYSRPMDTPVSIMKLIEEEEVRRYEESKED